jgi:hypothetical protein
MEERAAVAIALDGLWITLGSCAISSIFQQRPERRS